MVLINAGTLQTSEALDYTNEHEWTRMNPETRISEEQIERLCQKHAISFEASKRVTIGFSNEVHIISSEVVVKFYLPQGRRYETELAVLKQPTRFHKPRVIAHGEANDIIDRAYIFMSRIPGVPLGHVWHELSNDQRKPLIQQYIDAQKEIAAIRPEVFNFKTNASWFEILMADAKEETNKLLEASIISEQESMQAIAFIERLKNELNTDHLYPVFWDVHLDNLLVDDRGKLTGIIDFEHVKYASLDYPLFALRRLVTDPAKFATEENEKYAKTEDYQHMWSWYQQYYPEMFEFENLEERIKVYQLLDCLRLLEEWSHNQELVDRFRSLISQAVL